MCGQNSLTTHLSSAYVQGRNGNKATMTLLAFCSKFSGWSEGKHENFTKPGAWLKGGNWVLRRTKSKTNLFLSFKWESFKKLKSRTSSGFILLTEKFQGENMKQILRLITNIASAKRYLTAKLNSIDSLKQRKIRMWKVKKIKILCLVLSSCLSLETALVEHWSKAKQTVSLLETGEDETRQYISSKTVSCSPRLRY